MIETSKGIGGLFKISVEAAARIKFVMLQLKDSFFARPPSPACRDYCRPKAKSWLNIKRFNRILKYYCRSFVAGMTSLIFPLKWDYLHNEWHKPHLIHYIIYSLCQGSVRFCHCCLSEHYGALQKYFLGKSIPLNTCYVFEAATG